MPEAWILSAVRTPIGKFLGGLSPLAAPKLGALVVAESLRRAGIDPAAVDEVILGSVLQAGLGQNPARQAALGGGLPPAVPALTINKVCGSGLKAVALAAQAIRAGDAHLIVAGGMESMSNAPYLLPNARAGAGLGDMKLVDALVHDGLWDAFENFHMGKTAELVAAKFGIGRDRQDAFAVESHRRAVAAAKEGRFRDEILPVEVPAKKGPPARVEADEGPRPDSSPEGLAKLKPAFQADGTVTAGNASQISDGAAAVVVASDEFVKKLKVPPLAKITAYATGGVEPKWVMMAPVEAVKKLESRGGPDRRTMDLIEINEAFSAAACALLGELKLDPAKVNVNGGAVALGHPIGCTGARILTTLLYALKQRKLKRGLATLCLGGGNAVAMTVEMC